jgi:hypothetical protein
MQMEMDMGMQQLHHWRVLLLTVMLQLILTVMIQTLQKTPEQLNYVII